MELATNPVDQGAIGFGLDLFYSIGVESAALAVAAGAPCAVAMAMSKAMQSAVQERLADYCRRYGVGPFAEHDDPAVWAVDCIDPINWPNLAEIAGEPVDLDAWEAYARKRLADPDEEAA